MATRSAQTIDVYKSIQVQTTSWNVGCNTTSEKGTNTDQPVSYISIHSKYKPYMMFKYDDIDFQIPHQNILPISQQHLT